MLNVSEHGIGIDGLAAAVGTQIFFRLAGRGINHLGRGRVVHQTGTIAGVAVERRHGAPEAIQALISGERELGQRRADAHFTEWC